MKDCITLLVLFGNLFSVYFLIRQISVFGKKEETRVQDPTFPYHQANKISNYLCTYGANPVQYFEQEFSKTTNLIKVNTSD